MHLNDVFKKPLLFCSNIMSELISITSSFAAKVPRPIYVTFVKTLKMYTAIG